MPRGGVLSVDLYHPDCECCGAAGDMHVIRNQTSAPRTWFCIECDSSFDVRPESPWYGVDELPATVRGVYIDREIRGIPVAEVAQIRHVPADDVPGLVSSARRSIGTRRGMALA